jgi:hypothetical protein
MKSVVFLFKNFGYRVAAVDIGKKPKISQIAFLK